MITTSESSPGLQRVCDVLGAVATGLWLGVFYGWSRNSGEIPNADFIRCIVVGSLCFAVSALLLVSRKQSLWRIPIWAIVPVAGALITTVVIVLIPNFKQSWQFRTELQLGSTLREFLVAAMPKAAVDLAINLTIDILLTLPVMAIFHRLPKLFGAANKQPQDPNSSLRSTT